MGDIQEGVDVIIIGAGPGGYVAAIRAAQLGREVHLIDPLPRLGGICLNWGCIPSKALIHAANFFQDLDHSVDFGVEVSGKSLDVPKLQAWKDDLIAKLTKGIALLCRDNGISVHQGTAHFTSENSVLIESGDTTESLQFKNAVIATGSRPASLPSLPFDEAQGIVSSTEALAWQEIPESLAVIGGGYIGVELGTVYAKFGSQVTIIEALDRLLPEIEADIAKPVVRKLKKIGVSIVTGVRAKSYAKGQLSLENGDTVDATRVLVAVGRQPNTDGLQLEAAGIALDEHGCIKINQQCQTAKPHIYAIGDVAGGMQLAHKASHEGKVAAEAMCGQPAAFDNYVPAVIFSDPEIAMVGLTEEAAKQQGLAVHSGQFPFAVLGRSLASHATDGFVKVVAEEATKRLVGIQIVGGHASDLIAAATYALEMGALSDDVADMINTHPTFAEAIGEAVEALYGRAIHISPRKQKR